MACLASTLGRSTRIRFSNRRNMAWSNSLKNHILILVTAVGTHRAQTICKRISLNFALYSTEILTNFRANFERLRTASKRKFEEARLHRATQCNSDKAYGRVIYKKGRLSIFFVVGLTSVSSNRPYLYFFYTFKLDLACNGVSCGIMYKTYLHVQACPRSSSGGSVVQWLERRTCNPEDPGSRPTLTASWSCFSVAPSSTPRPRL